MSKALPANKGLAEEVVAVRAEVAKRGVEDACAAAATASQPQVAPPPHTRKGRRMVIEEASEEPDHSSRTPAPVAAPVPQRRGIPIEEETEEDEKKVHLLASRYMRCCVVWPGTQSASVEMDMRMLVWHDGDASSGLGVLPTALGLR